MLDIKPWPNKSIPFKFDKSAFNDTEKQLIWNTMEVTKNFFGCVKPEVIDSL